MAKKNSDKINFDILSEAITVIEEDGTRLVGLTNQAAQKLAQDRSLDLIEVSINKHTGESVCKITDYSKYCYNRRKKEKAAEKLQRENSIDTKEIQLRPNIEEHDITIKAKKTLQFLDNGDRVRIILSMRNRELSHKDVGENVMATFMSNINSEDVENPIHSEGNNLVAVLFRKRK